MKRILNIVLILVACAAAAGCEKFLDVKPSKTASVVIETGDHLEGMLNFYKVYYSENSPWLVNASDDEECSISWYNLTGNVKCEGYSNESLSYALWDTEIIPKLTDVTWKAEYEKIFYANTILEKADKVTGLTDEERESIKQEARFIRAYSCWYLAQVYCLPYIAGNENKQGIVLKTSTHFDEPVNRATLKETYDFIEADLAEALKIDKPLTKIGDTNRWRSFRASKAAVNGFAARYYLYRNDYENALKYADIALAAHGDLVDYNTEMSFWQSSPTATVDGKTVTIQVPYTFEGGSGNVNERMFEWKEFMYFRMCEDKNWWYMPSQALLNLYDKQYDLRYKYHIVENYSYIDLPDVSTPLPAYCFFWKDMIPSGPTTAEMILIKAECEARTGNVSAAMATVNRLRAVRMDKSAPSSVINLAASGQEEAVKKILEERRREMPFVCRFMDIRRLNSNEVEYDDPGDLTKTFYAFTMTNIDKGNTKTYKLEKNSSRYACPLPETEFVASDYVIDQNIYQ